MKKSTKSTKPAAPQVKSVVPKPVVPKSAKQTKAPKKVVAKSAKGAKSAKPLKAAPKALPRVTPAPKLTTITAKIDIGFGNTLFLRGEGPGLSWNHGVALDCVDDDKWSITLPGAHRAVIFKFLVNDLTWSAGSDYIVDPGSTSVFVPAF
jgi:hypothetical protein